MRLDIAMAAINRMLKYPLLMALALALAAPLAHADRGGGGGGRFGQREDNRQNFPQRQPQQQPYFQREAPPQFPRRDDGYGGEQQRPQRLSPDERRQLRRDVHDAGRDLYAPRR